MHIVLRAARTCACALLAASGALGLATAGLADDEPVTFVYRIDREALGSTDGAHRVYRDIERKAHEACSEPYPTFRDLADVDRDCVAELIDSVVSRVRDPRLTAQHKESPRAQAMGTGGMSAGDFERARAGASDAPG